MDKNFILDEMNFGILKQIPLFAELSDGQIQDFTHQTKILTLNEDEVLFHQGNDSDKMYVLITGGLIAILEHKNVHSELIYVIHPGETVGEMGFLTEKPRALTVKAVEKSVLIEISQKLFFDLISTSSHMVQILLWQVIDRSQKTIEKKRKNGIN